MNEFQSTQSDKQNLSFSTIQGVLSLLPDSRCPKQMKTGSIGISRFEKSRKLDRKYIGSSFKANFAGFSVPKLGENSIHTVPQSFQGPNEQKLDRK